jgi:cytochrome P450
VGSSNYIFKEEVKLDNGKYTIKKGQPFGFFIHNIHHDPEEWREPD